MTDEERKMYERDIEQEFARASFAIAWLLFLAQEKSEPVASFAAEYLKDLQTKSNLSIAKLRGLL